MTNAEQQPAVVRTDSSAPPMPSIREHERYAGSPYLLVDGTSRMIGWQWSPPEKGGPEFVIAGRTGLGNLKILERFPLTETGWANAWRSIRSDQVAAGKVAARLAKRAAEDAAAPAESGQPATVEPMLIVTSNEVPGHRITEVHGDVFGLVVRSGDWFANFGASFRGVFGGEVSGYTQLLIASRNQARERMWREARSRGANAIIAMRFDCNSIATNMSEVAAYGTAVTVEPLVPPARPGPAEASFPQDAIRSGPG